MQIKILAKWLKICRVMIKRVLIFLEGIVCKHLLVWAFFCLSTFTFGNIGLAGASKNIYRKFLIIKITLRDHIYCWKLSV